MFKVFVEMWKLIFYVSEYIYKKAKRFTKIINYVKYKETLFDI